MVNWRPSTLSDSTKPKHNEANFLTFFRLQAPSQGLWNCWTLANQRLADLEMYFSPTKKLAPSQGQEAIEEKQSTKSTRLLPTSFKKRERESTVITTRRKWAQKTFCSEKRQETELAKQLQDLRKKTEKYSLIKSSLDAESSSSEDHLDS